MKFIKKQLENIKPFFEKGQPLAVFFPVYEALDSFLLTTGKKNLKAPYVRDAVDLKRVMVFVIVALIPCILMGIYNTGYQMLKAQQGLYSFAGCWILGAKKVFPIIMITYLIGGFWEVLFATWRKHEINEGFLVTGMLFALILPPSIPLWQVAVGISFGVVVGKEIFGGTGFNVFNPALTGRAFLFFAYTAQMSGDSVWIAVDGLTQATPLAFLANSSMALPVADTLQRAGYSFSNIFWGFVPGSIGETSTFACLLGLIFLILTKIANWRIILSCFLGLLTTSSAFLLICLFKKEGSCPLLFSVAPHWHMIMGGFAFGAIFMATDPVSSCATNRGRWIYGFFIGFFVVIIRVLNPAYPEGVMLAILFMNIFAPLIDHFVVEQHIKKRNKLLKVK